MTWYVEEGIGEERAIRLDGGDIAEARVHWPGPLVPGQVEDAKLIQRRAATPRGIAEFAGGEQALVDRLPGSASEGATLRLEVTRAAMREVGRAKPAQARPTDKPPRPAPGLADQLRNEGKDVRVVRRFPPEAAWEELWQEAELAQVPFPGGSLGLYPAPAMLLIDIDGDDDPFALAKAAVEPIARALRRFALAGNIGIDFPTLARKAERKAIDDALGLALAGWPHERTAMNGFGFVQLVARHERPSLLSYAGRLAEAHARLLLRRAERIEEPGILLLRCTAAVRQALRDEWLAELARRTGREVRVESGPDHSNHAQAIAS